MFSFREASIQCPKFAVQCETFNFMVQHALQSALIGDLELVSQGNEPRLLSKLESPILGLEIHLSTDMSDQSNSDTEWIPTRRTRLSCALSGTSHNYQLPTLYRSSNIYVIGYNPMVRYVFLNGKGVPAQKRAAIVITLETRTISSGKG